MNADPRFTNVATANQFLDDRRFSNLVAAGRFAGQQVLSHLQLPSMIGLSPAEPTDPNISR